MHLDAIHVRIHRVLDENANRFIALSQSIWESPELAFEEHHAVTQLTVHLEEAGFVIERGLAGLDTAFRATWGNATGPTIALLCEYDALRGLGHACGHNLIGTGSAAAGWALKNAWSDLPGRLQVIGTPAEEDGGGKILLQQRGVFDDIDAAIMFHPSSGVSKAHRGGLALHELKVNFLGHPAHAAAAPWDGVNALDAMISFFVSIGLLRQQIRDGARIHGIITHGGDASNIIPERTEAELTARAERVEYLATIVERLKGIAHAAALSTGCHVEFERGMLYENRINNMTMARTFERHLNALGEPTEEPDPKEGVGSSDIGNVSRVCPTIHPYVSISPDPAVAGHTQAFCEASSSEYGHAQMLKAAKAMACTAADLFGRPELLEQAKEEFRRSLAHAA